MDQAARGAAALKASNFEEAIKLYTSAIASNPNAVDYYIKRSTAHQRSSPPDYQAALSDAEIAVVLAFKRAKRELIKDSQLRRAIALFFLERYADAQYIFGVVKRLDDKEKTLTIWNKKVADKMVALSEDDERRKTSVKEIPDVEIPSSGTLKSTTNPNQGPSSASNAATSTPKPVVPTPANKIKHDWYQNSENVYFTLLAKGVPKDKATIEIAKHSLSISFPIEETSTYEYSLDPLFAPVIPEKSTSTITASKIEITLKKATPSVKWHSLEGTKDASAASSSEEKPQVPNFILNPKAQDNPPSYPTSSKTGPKDWDKVANELTAKKPKKDGDNEDDDLDAGDGGDETTRFFKQLYQGADPDQRRAMMKSFSESGGTVLSTDWSNVGSKKIVPEPPEGMEAKPY
ncbi:SGS-domain-containing protein [Glonium stellatum]|uniref:SGS-domain-containing protein n=1 Tax=Glonium stellatum TaxID=574774 RepID=A0A8E2JQ34_9PEZI|nr:SGS-domain-containing protein [Glonium stellatum]